MEKKTQVVHIRLEDSVVETLKALARADDRKLSPFMARILKQYAEGDLVPKKKKP